VSPTTFRVEEATIADIHAAMRAGELTCRALVEAYLQRIDAYDRSGPALNSILGVNEAALERADELDDALGRTGEPVGPLHGIPVLVKDCVETSEIDTTFGSAAVEGYRPAEDAVVVRKLREAGAIILAKTTLPDFATSWFSFSSVSEETKNPYALDHDPGGSSAGTGAAVAANLGAVGIGTDCGGSIRVPSSFCNLVGVRSTPGVVPRTGSSYLVIFQDTIGPMTRTVTDAATVFDAIVGYDATDPYTAAYAIARAPRSYRDELDARALEGARIGIVTNALGSGDDPAGAGVNDVVRAAVEAIRAAGADVIEVAIPNVMDHIVATSQYVARTKHDINAFLAARPELAGLTLPQIVERKQYHPELDLIDAVMEGPDVPEDDPDYFRRFAAREAFTREVVNVMAARGLEALVYPSVQVPPPSMDGRKDWTVLTFPTNTLIASQTWMPAMSVPAGFTADGLPVGLEFVAKPYDEPTVFRLGYAFEQATHHRRAPASAPALAAAGASS
jgi:Asp-tRNA(Asn)/Glu-tRNA(Gln) amidotransferase A subunit family amidase